MKHPKGAVKTTEQMQKLLGKTVYLTLPPRSGDRIPRVSKFIVKLTPIKIESARNYKNEGKFYLHTAELVNAAKDYAIITNSNWSVTWGDWSDAKNMGCYYFANYWHAYAFTLRLEEDVYCC